MKETMECLFHAEQIASMLHDLAGNVDRKNPEGEICLVGIRKRGVPLSHRLKQHLIDIRERVVDLGVLDITLYRDDLGLRSDQPVVRRTEIDFDVTDKTIILVDDVLFTGRTARAALDALIDFGRPKSIQLAILIDRGHRQLPIQADFVGEKVKTAFDDLVLVRLKETDGEDIVLIQKGTRGRA